MTVIFDTLKLAKELRDQAGFPQKQAEGLATALGHSTAEALATKTDIAEVKADIAEVRTEVAELRSEMKTEVAEVRSEIAEVRTEVAELRSEMKTEVAEVRTEIARLETKMQQMKAELLKWFIAIISGQAIFIVTMIKLL